MIKLLAFTFITLLGMKVHAQERVVHQIIQEIVIAVNTGNLENTMDNLILLKNVLCFLYQYMFHHSFRCLFEAFIALKI